MYVCIHHFEKQKLSKVEFLVRTLANLITLKGDYIAAPKGGDSLFSSIFVPNPAQQNILWGLHELEKNIIFI